jgi:hypothetical protein
MIKNLNPIIFLLFLVFHLSACKKEKNISNDATLLKENVQQFLLEKKSQTNSKQAGKIQSLLQQLSDNGIEYALTKDIKIVVFDLKSYRNITTPGYRHSFYKAIFTKQKEKISDCVIYTIHTNYEKLFVDQNFNNIFLFNPTSFSGEIVVNSMNDGFIQSSVYRNGVMEKSSELKMENPNNVSTNSSATSNAQNCISYYLVTTTFYADGHIERDYMYLYTLCGSCIPTGQPATTIIADCNDESGGGSDDITVDNSSETIEVEENGPPGPAPKISYNYRAIVTRRNTIVQNVVIEPISVNNPVVFYTDTHGRNTTRALTLFGHLNTWIPLGNTARIFWSCMVHGKWTYTNGDPMYTKVWSNSNTAIR